MADIANQIKTVRESVYGREMRESFAVGFELINEECEDTTAKSVAKIEEMNTLKRSLNDSEATRVEAENSREHAEGERQTETTAAIERCDSKVNEINTKLTNGDFIGDKGDKGDTGNIGPQGEPGSIINARAIDIATDDGSNAQAKINTLDNLATESVYIKNGKILNKAGMVVGYTKAEIDVMFSKVEKVETLYTETLRFGESTDIQLSKYKRLCITLKSQNSRSCVFYLDLTMTLAANEPLLTGWPYLTQHVYSGTDKDAQGRMWRSTVAVNSAKTKVSYINNAYKEKNGDWQGYPPSGNDVITLIEGIY